MKTQFVAPRLFSTPPEPLFYPYHPFERLFPIQHLGDDLDISRSRSVADRSTRAILCCEAVHIDLVSAGPATVLLVTNDPVAGFEPRSPDDAHGAWDVLRVAWCWVVGRFCAFTAAAGATTIAGRKGPAKDGRGGREDCCEDSHSLHDGKNKAKTPKVKVIRSN